MVKISPGGSGEGRETSLFLGVPFGRDGFPFNLSPSVDYGLGTCPVTERMEDKELLLFVHIHSQLEEADLDDVARAMAKVLEGAGALAALERAAE